VEIRGRRIEGKHLRELRVLRGKNRSSTGSMKRINSYLTFNGNCRDAMLFYRECLGGELSLQTIGESPLAEKMPEPIKSYIVHSTLASDGLVLLASDMTPSSGLVRGNAVSLSLECGSESEIRECYGKLASDGSADYPLEETFWGALFGGLTDRFGNHWLLSFTNKQ
jgi:PhnB protein